MYSKTTIDSTKYGDRTITDELYPSIFELKDSALKTRLNSSSHLGDSIQRFGDEARDVITGRKEAPKDYDKFKILLAKNGNLGALIEYLIYDSQRKIESLDKSIQIFILVTLKKIPKESGYYDKAQEISGKYYILKAKHPRPEDENTDELIVKRAGQLQLGISYLMNSSNEASFKNFEEIIKGIKSWNKIGVKGRNGILIFKLTGKQGQTIFEVSIEGILALFKKANDIRTDDRKRFEREEYNHGIDTWIKYQKTYFHLVHDFIVNIGESIPHITPFMRFYDAIQSIWNDIPEYYRHEIERRKKELEEESPHNPGTSQ